MIDLTRTVRFFLRDVEGDALARHNTFAAWPPPRGLCPFYQLHVECRGEIDTLTGYFMNIKEIDQAVRDHALARFRAAARAAGRLDDVPMGRLMRDLFDALQPPLKSSVHRIRLDLSPFYSLTLGSDDMNHLTITQKYEFCAAHRLHVDRLSDGRNRAIFGKCNNPSGHGHNYQVEVVVRAPIRADGHAASIEQLDALVDDAVIQKFDHKQLNVDLPEFADVNPSVENIARVIHDILAARVPKLGLELETVSVWETGKTKCTYGKQTAGV